MIPFIPTLTRLVQNQFSSEEGGKDLEKENIPSYFDVPGDLLFWKKIPQLAGNGALRKLISVSSELHSIQSAVEYIKDKLHASEHFIHKIDGDSGDYVAFFLLPMSDDGSFAIWRYVGMKFDGSSVQILKKCQSLNEPSIKSASAGEGTNPKLSGQDYDLILSQMVSIQTGKEIALLGRSCAEGEFIDSIFDPETDPALFRYFNFSIRSLDGTIPTVAFTIRPVKYLDTSFSKTAEAVKEMTAYYRKHFPLIVENVVRGLSARAGHLLLRAAKRTAEKFRVHMAVPKELDAKGAAFANKYIDILSSLAPDQVASVMLHELIHATFAEISDDDWALFGKNLGWAQSLSFTPFKEGIVEYLTRYAIKITPNIDFEHCPCSYYGADVLYYLIARGDVSLDDAIFAEASNNAAPFQTNELKRKYGNEFVLLLFSPVAMNDRDRWLRKVASLLKEAAGEPLFNDVMNNGLKDKMITYDIFDVINEKPKGQNCDTLTLPRF